MAKKYSNRTDLQNPAKKMAATAAKGQTYGEAGKQMAAQRAVPMAAPAVASAPQRPRNAVAPGSMGAFNRDTTAPDEPVTAGANVGPGPNAFQSGITAPPMFGNPVLQELIVLNQLYPSDDLKNLISVLTDKG
jgi:hypothetical protein